MPVALTFSFIGHLYSRHSNLTYFTQNFIEGVCPKDPVDFEVKDDYTIIGEWAFEDCVSLKTIKLPKSIKTINESAFYNCSSLQTIDLLPSLTTLGDDAF